MALQPLVEFIESLEGPGGNKIATRGTDQAIVDDFPAGAMITVSLYPPTGAYAYVMHRLELQGITPDVFEMEIDQHGAKPYRSIITQNQTRNGVDFLLFATASLPARFVVSSLSAWPQYYEHFLHFLTIANEADYDMVRKAIRKWG